MTGPAVADAAALGPEDGALVVEFCGEWFPVARGETFTVGREADLAIDDNPFLHRTLLELRELDGIWVIRNVGTRLAVTVTDGLARVQSWLAPSAWLPLVFGLTTVVFTAGPTTYELTLHIAAPPFQETAPRPGSGATTVGDVTFTLSQRLAILALAEPMLRREGVGIGEIPTSAQAAARLGWGMTRFHRKIDNVCDKLDRIGVQGMRGGPRSYATNRRIRLVEYAIAARLVTRADLPLLDQANVDSLESADQSVEQERAQ